MFALLPALLSIVALQSPAADSRGWPQWRGQGDGLSHGEDWSSAGETLWTAEIGLGYSAPSVVGNDVVVYGHDAERGLDVLRCLDATSGRERWRAELPGELRANQHEGGTLSTPALLAEEALVFSTNGVLSSHRLRDGTLAWRADLAQRHGLDPEYYGFAASPIVVGGRIWIAADRVLAVAPETGATLWVGEPLEARYSTPVDFALGGRARMAVFSQNALHLLDPETGKEEAAFPWRQAERRVNAASPVVVGEDLFLSSAYDHGCALVRFEPEGPRALFQNRAMRNKMAGCILVGGHLYGFDESVLKCLDLEGNERWRVRGLGNGAIAGGDGKLALLSSRGELVIARATPEAFVELSRTDLFEEGVCWTPPVITGGRLYLRNNRGTLVCRDQRQAQAPEPIATDAEVERSLPAAADLFARHLEALGGAQTLARYPRIRLTGTYEQRSVGFLPVPFEILQEAPDRRRVWIRLPAPLDEMLAEEGVPGHLARVHDGTESFERNRYRGDRLYSAGEAREERVAARLAFLADGAAGYSGLRTEGPVSFDERSCYRVIGKATDGKTRTLYFEVASGWLAGREAEDEALAIYRDYRSFEGLAIATTRRLFRPEGGLEEVFRIEGVELGPVEGPIGRFFDDAFERGETIDALIEDRESAEAR